MLSKVRTTLNSAFTGNDDPAVLSRREMLAGIGAAGIFAVAGSTLLASSTAEARPVKGHEAAPMDAGKTEVAEGGVSEPDLESADLTEFSAQPWRRQRRRYYRRRLRRGRRYYRRWRRRARVVCRRRWVRGRLVRACRRVWW